MATTDPNGPHRGSHPALDHADAVVALHMEYERNVTRHQRAVERLTSWIGRPFLFYTVVSLSLVWISFNLYQIHTGGHVFDHPPFYTLQSLWAFASLLVTIIVLITQNRQVKVDQRQVQLALQLSLLADQKTAKIISLLEELRRDSPQIRDRVDPEAEVLRETVAAEELAIELEKRIREREEESLLGE